MDTTIEQSLVLDLDAVSSVETNPGAKQIVSGCLAPSRLIALTNIERCAMVLRYPYADA